jgi:hypothetical protein
MKKFSVTALCVALTACASSSPITAYGSDAYIINSEDFLGVNSAGGLQVKAAKQANEFCATQGKTMIVKTASGEGVHMITGTSSNLVFSCVAPQGK